MRTLNCSILLFASLFLFLSPVAGQDATDVVEYAESAGIPEIAAAASILDAEGNVVREGTNGWTCIAAPEAPMCLDAEWTKLVGALMSGNEDYQATSTGISYMLRGDAGASNTDPFATGPTDDNHWVVTGPHIMLISPDPNTLSDLPTEPSGGGPYIMWHGTPFAHVMIPVVGDAVSMLHNK